jgi:hypothetical protein
MQKIYSSESKQFSDGGRGTAYCPIDSKYLDKKASVLEEIANSWKEPVVLSASDINLPDDIGISAARIKNAIHRTYCYVSCFSPFGPKAYAELIGWDWACEMQARPWASDYPPRFGRDVQLEIGHDLYRCEVYFATANRDQPELVAAWRSQVVEPILAYKEKAKQILSCKCYSEWAVGDGNTFDVHEAGAMLDLLCISLDYLIPLSKNAKSPKREKFISEDLKGGSSVGNPGKQSAAFYNWLNSIEGKQFKMDKPQGAKLTRNDLARAIIKECPGAGTVESIKKLLAKSRVNYQSTHSNDGGFAVILTSGKPE